MSKHEFKWSALLCVLLFLLPSGIVAQPEQFELAFPVRGDVNKMKFDTTGFLWFHDSKEYYRYNGHQTQPVGLGDLLDKRKYDYIMYSDVIIIGDEILFMNDDKLSFLRPQSGKIRDGWKLPKQRYFSYVYQDELDHIWVVSAHRQNDSRIVYHSEDGVEFREAFDLIDLIGDQAIYWDFFEMNDKDGVIYFLWRWGDMLMIDRDGNKLEPELNNPQEFQKTRTCSQFRLDNQKNLWRIYRDTFEILNEATHQFELHPFTGRLQFATNCKKEQDIVNRKLGLPEIGSLLDLRFIHTDRKNRIWMGCAASYLLCYDPASQTVHGFRSELVSALGGGDNDITEMIEDTDGNLWGAKTGGIFKIRDREVRLKSYLRDTENPDHEIYQNRDDKTLNRILAYYNDYAIRNTSIHSMGEDQKGNLIFQEGVFTYRLNLASRNIDILPIVSPKESVHLTYNDDLQIMATWDAYYRINEDFSVKKMTQPILKVEQTLKQKNGNVWVVGLLNNFNYLFAKLDPASLEFNGNYLDADGQIDLSINKPNAMDEDEDGNLWIATDEGLIMLDTEKEEFTSFPTTLKQQGKEIKTGPLMVSVHCLPQHKLWLQSKYEIILLDIRTETIQAYIPIDEDIAGSGTTILPEGDSAIWIGDQTGLTYRNLKKNTSANFGLADGLDLTATIQVLRKLKNGELAIGTTNGLYLVNPESLLLGHALQLQSDAKIPLRMTAFSLIFGDDGELRESKFGNTTEEKIELSYNDKMIELEYSLMNFNFPERQLYSTWMEGFDPGWSPPTPDNSVTYTSLPPGDYTFRVRASTGRGSWGETEIAQELRVHQAWFWSAWFIVPSLLLLCLVGFLIVRFYYQQKLERRIAIEKVRNKISRDLHDDVGSVLAGISMQSEFLSFAPKEADKGSLKELSTRSREAMDKMRDIVWAMNADRDKYENLLDRMRAFLETQLSKTNIAYQVKYSGFEGPEAIAPEIRQNLYFLFKEAVTNAAKHSNGDKLFTSLVKSPNGLKLEVRDNGTHFNNKPSSGLGLLNMKRRAEALGGTLDIEREDGFTVCVNVPL